MNHMKNLKFKAYFAELLGTFLLVFAGTTVAVTTGNILYVALTFGLVVVAMAYSIGSISGAHLNPAVSLALAVSKRLSYKDFAFYTIFQVSGAILASGLLSLVLGSSNALAGNMMQAAVSSQSVFVLLLLAALFVTFFVYVICTVTS